jgi:beta-N-acetylhexosaminidase
LRTGLFIVAGAGMVLQAGVMAGCGPADPSARSASRPAVARLVERLTVQQLAGQLVIYSYRGLRPPAALLRRISAGQAAGVIFFRDNLGSSAQIRAVIGQLQQAAARSPVTAPLLLMTDQEGGVVRRLPGAPALSEKQIGASTDPLSAARTAGQGAGRNLRAVGMNVNLAPVLDVFRAPGNFIDRFGRSYSSNPRTVSKLGSAFIVAQQQAGVAATAKHFPGLGAATPEQNTDERAVTLRLPLAELRAKEELPYRSAISAKVGLVMVSWATYPALDPRRPAGLSSKIVQGELRGRLKFRGVTITDSIGAHALRSFGATPQRAVLAARAGMDLLLCAGRSVRQGTSVVHALATALANGRLDLARVQASVSRVIALRASLASARR